jgi:hypothetical protein
MPFRPIAATLLAFAAILATAEAQDAPASKPPAPKKKILVELFTSQGCNSCPPANQLLAQLGSLGYGPDQVVPIAFHVDYFNTPWVDKFSSKEFSLREKAYNTVLKRDDLYFTPMMMVDGQTPLVGTHRSQALTAIKKGLAEPAGASIKLTVAGKDPNQAATVEIIASSKAIVGRSLMVGLVVTEGPMTTYVTSGENDGAALVEPAVARLFAFKKSKLEADGRETFKFPIALPSDALPTFCRVAAFVQDWENGKIYQAESIPLAERAKPKAKTASR